MLWICRECGVEISADDDLVATWIGWIALDGDTGICPPCGGLAASESASARLRQAAHRRERSDRAITTTRLMIDRARQRRWDETTLELAADRLGHSPEVCRDCDSRTRACVTCEGAGIVWRRGDGVISGSGLLRLAMWPGGGRTR